MPPVMRKRGRPKGHEVTVIGLPAKRPRGKQKHSDPRREWSLLSNFILRSKREVAIQLLDLTVYNLGAM